MGKRILILFLLAVSEMSFASDYGGGDSDGIYFSIGVKALYGTMVSGDSTTLVARNLIDYEPEAVLGYEFSGIILGVGASYGFWRQLTDPTTISGSNTQGTQLNESGVLGYDLDWVILLAKYHFSSTYTCDRSNSAGQQVSYLVPQLPLTFQLLFPAWDGSRIGLEYTTVQYSQQSVGGVNTNLDSNSQVSLNAYGVIYEMYF